MNQATAILSIAGLRSLRHRLAAALHCMVSFTILLLTVGCCEGRPVLGSMEDNGADEVIAVVQRAQCFQAAPVHGEEPVFTAHHRKPSAQMVRSAMLEAEQPLDGHRYANGLNAPLRQ
jgi:hypothetical protein